MSAAFDLALGAAFHSLQMARGVSASYKVSSTNTIANLTIVPGETVREDLGADGLVYSHRIQDYLIKVSDLLGNEPKESHEITVNSEVFRLVRIDNEKAFRFFDPPNNSVYRIHTVLKTGDPG